MKKIYHLANCCCDYHRCISVPQTNFLNYACMLKYLIVWWE